MPRKATPVAEPTLELPVEETVVETTPFSSFIEHQKRAVTEASKALGALLPEGAREHGETALKEMVEGYRSLFNSTLDEIIKSLEKARLDETAAPVEEKTPVAE
jgi:hypothetical protein